jgi:predicted alpha/beta superfamily hydrolase
MRKAIFSLTFVILSLYSLSQTDGKVVIGTVDSVQSKILGEKRKVWVHVPSGVGSSSKQRYPVVYLLDGTAHFYSVVGLIQQFSQVNGNTLCPEMIVVGIANTDRTRDFTPTHVESDPPYMTGDFAKTSGGGDGFLSFIEKELIPHIDARYPTRPYRTLIGHSFGGLMAIHAFIYHTNLFNAYIAIDPSLWWENMRYLERTRRQLRGKSFSGTSLYMGYANTLEEGMDISTVEKDSSAMSRHVRSIIALDRDLKTEKRAGLDYQSRYYSDDSHTTVPLIAEHDALRHIFRNHRFNLTTNDFLDPYVDIAARCQKHYRELSGFFGYEVLPSESYIKGWADEFFRQKQHAKAEKLYALNVNNYPSSFEAHESLGDYYLAVGDKSRAAGSFRKALSIQENEACRRKLNGLMK